MPIYGFLDFLHSEREANFFELQFKGPLLILKVSSGVIGVTVSVFTINWEIWLFLFPHGSLFKVFLRIGSEERGCY